MDIFPSNKIEAITMLILQQKDITDLSPAAVVALYSDTKKEVDKAFSPERETSTPRPPEPKNPLLVGEIKPI